MLFGEKLEKLIDEFVFIMLYEREGGEEEGNFEEEILFKISKFKNEFFFVKFKLFIFDYINSSLKVKIVILGSCFI